MMRAVQERVGFGGGLCGRTMALLLEVPYFGAPGGGISLGQCKWCMIWLPLNLFQERRCYVFFLLFHAIYMFVEDTLRLSWADQNQDWLRFTWWLDFCMLLLRSLWRKALWFWHRQSFNYWGGLTGRPAGSASPCTYVPPVHCPHCALVNFAYGCIAADDKKTIKEKTKHTSHYLAKEWPSWSLSHDPGSCSFLS